MLLTGSCSFYSRFSGAEDQEGINGYRGWLSIMKQSQFATIEKGSGYRNEKQNPPRPHTLEFDPSCRERGYPRRGESLQPTFLPKEQPRGWSCGDSRRCDFGKPPSCSG